MLLPILNQTNGKGLKAKKLIDNVVKMYVCKNSELKSLLDINWH